MGASELTRLGKRGLWAGFALLLLNVVISSSAIAAEEPPYEFDAARTLTGSCSTPPVDPVPDPGCPGGSHPPKAFSKPLAIAVDAFGNEYVANYGTGTPEGSDGRIDIFNAEGEFITEVADPFGPTSIAVDSKGNLYVIGRRPGLNHELAVYPPVSPYNPAAGEIEYGTRKLISDDTKIKNSVAVDRANDHVFVAHGSEISEYGPFAEENKLLDTITNKELYSNQWIAFDSQRRRMYASSCPTLDITDCGVVVLEADDPHALLKVLDGSNTPAGEFTSSTGWTSIAVDEETGGFFVEDLEQSNRVFKFDENYGYVSTLEFERQGNEALQIALSNAAGATNHRYLYMPSVIKGKGYALAFSPPGEVPPEIETVAVGSIGETEAELQAQIDPGGGLTTYTFEYTTQAAFEEKGFEGATVAPQGTLTPAQQEAKVTTPVSGLSPGTAYRFRVTAENEKGKNEAGGSFATYADARVSSMCANQALRSSFSAMLPDCRAYELVTPPDTNGRPTRGVRFTGDRFPTLEASPAGSAISFVTEGGALPGTVGAGAFNGDLYRSIREASGWTTQGAGASGTESVAPEPGSTSPDQGYAFWIATRQGSAVIDGKNTHYIRYPDGHSELVGRGSLGTDPAAVGGLITEGGTHIVFETPAVQLEPNAPPTGTTAVYDRIKNPVTGAEETKVVSLLPGDETPAAGQNAEYLGASDDGEGIAFSIGGTLYLRVNNEETFLAGSGLTFAGVAEGGSRIFYMEGGDLKALDTTLGEAGEEIAFTNLGNVTPVNVSKDGSRAYFVSTFALGDENPNGALPVAGQRNLYLSEEGAISFVGTVTARDVDGESRADGQVDGLGLWAAALGGGELVRDPSRLNPDGTVLLFSSRANLDGYDPEGAPQVYRYDHSSDRLHCISCIPTKQPASGGASLQSFAWSGDTIPPFSHFGFVQNLTPSGDRVFFQSTEALVSSDTNEVQDVYEWEEQTVGGCVTPGGCVYLISSGHTDKDNYLYGMSRSGDDVFFSTSDLLTDADASDTVSIYDARVNGGFPSEKASTCVEAGDCRAGSSPPPLLPAPASEAPAAPPAKKPLCPKGKRKVKRGGKVVCVKKKKQHKDKAGKTAGKGARK